MAALLGHPRAAIVALLASTTLFSGCAGLRPGFETPSVTVSSFRALPSTGVMPEFEIGLRVVNPNREALRLAGLSYTIDLDGREIIKGVSNELPVIEGYGSGDIMVTAAPDVLGSVGFIMDLMQQPRDAIRYSIEAKLDIGTFMPAIRVRDEGEISLRQSR